MTVRDSAPLLLSGTAFQAVVGDASGPAAGEMWENQLAGVGIFWGQIQKVVQLSKLGFPTSNPSPVVNSLDHGLEAPCHEARNRAQSFSVILERSEGSDFRRVHRLSDPLPRSRMTRPRISTEQNEIAVPADTKSP